MRFEKSQDPHNTTRALARALELLPLISPGIRLVGGLADHHAIFTAPAPVDLDLDWLARKLGRTLVPSEVRGILESLQFGVEPTEPGHFAVTIPSWRATKDVATPEDLVEEVGRMIGYDSIDPRPPLVPCAPSYDPPEREFLRTVRRLMAARGHNEVSNYSFISEESARRFGLAIEDHVRVLNPIAAGQELMRTSLLPGIHANIVENAKHFDDFRIFEIGHEIHRVRDAKPKERPHLMAALYSKDALEGLLELKRTAESLAPGLHVRPAAPKSWEHPVRCAELWWQGREIGRPGVSGATTPRGPQKRHLPHHGRSARPHPFLGGNHRALRPHCRGTYGSRLRIPRLDAQLIVRLVVPLPFSAQKWRTKYEYWRNRIFASNGFALNQKDM